MFHKGAEIPGRFACLEGDGKEARSVKVQGLDDLALKADELAAICIAWCDMRDKG